jgi:hypothetical protein
MSKQTGKLSKPFTFLLIQSINLSRDGNRDVLVYPVLEKRSPPEGAVFSGLGVVASWFGSA